MNRAKIQALIEIFESILNELRAERTKAPEADAFSLHIYRCRRDFPRVAGIKQDAERFCGQSHRMAKEMGYAGTFADWRLILETKVPPPPPPSGESKSLYRAS